MSNVPTPTARHEEEARRLDEQIGTTLTRPEEIREAIAAALARAAEEGRADGRAEAGQVFAQKIQAVLDGSCFSKGSHGDGWRGGLNDAAQIARSLSASPPNPSEPPKSSPEPKYIMGLDLAKPGTRDETVRSPAPRQPGAGETETKQRRVLDDVWLLLGQLLHVSSEKDPRQPWPCDTPNWHRIAPQGWDAHCASCFSSWFDTDEGAGLLTQPTSSAVEAIARRCMHLIASLSAPQDLAETDERCESGCAEPVTHHDSEGIPLCEACWQSLCAEESGRRAALQEAARMAREWEVGWRREAELAREDGDEKNAVLRSVRANECKKFADKLTALASSGAAEQTQGSSTGKLDSKGARADATERAEQPDPNRQDAGSSPAPGTGHDWSVCISRTPRGPLSSLPARYSCDPIG